MVTLEDKPSCRGDIHLKVYRRGKLVETIDNHNLVVNTGRIRLAEFLTGQSVPGVKYIGLGSGGDDEQETDTRLTDQILLELTKRSVRGRDARFDFVIDENTANDMIIREFGLFTSDGVMFSHRVRRNSKTGKAMVIEKSDDISITGYWIIHF